MGVPERGICNDKIAEATSVKVEVLHISNSGQTFQNKTRQKPASLNPKQNNNFKVKSNNVEISGDVLKSHFTECAF